MDEPARCVIEDGVARITLDDGKVNVMSTAMIAALEKALDQAEAEKAACVVLRSAREKVFSAGFDVKIFASGDAEASLAMLRGGAELLMRMMVFPAPILAVVEGHAYPAGAFMLMASDLRIGAAGDYKIGLNEVAIGLSPPSYSIELVKSRIHPAYASRTAVTAEMFGPEDAVKAGFLDHLVARDALEAEVAAAIERLKALHGPSCQLTKKRLRRDAIAAMRRAADAELTPERLFADAI